MGYKNLGIANNTIIPEKTTFVTKGKNLFDGVYVSNIRQGGASPYVVTASVGAKAVIFKGESGKTYTITKSPDTDYFGIATFISYPSVGVAGNRGICGNSDGYLTRTVTLEGTEEYILISVSSSTQSLTPERLQIEESAVATFYTTPNSVKILLEQEPIFPELPKMNIVKIGDNLKIYVPSKSNSSRYVRFEYARIVNAGANLDTWSLKTTGIYTVTNGIYTLDFMVSTESDNEGVVKIQGEADFVGGLHGYEINEMLDVIIDGNQVDMSANFNVECSFIKITTKSRVYHDLTTTKAFTRYKVQTWDINSYTLEGRWIAETAITVTSSKLCDYSIDKINNSKNIIKWGRNDYDYVKQDVSGAFSGGITTPRTGIIKQELWGVENYFYIAVMCEFDRSLYPNNYQYIEDLTIRAKIYFDLTGSHTLTAGAEIRYKNIYDFRF